MKITTCGKTYNTDWYGLELTTNVPMSWTVTFETLGWETWKVTVTTPNGVSSSWVLKKTGNKPSISINKKRFYRNAYHYSLVDANIEDYEEK